MGLVCSGRMGAVRFLFGAAEFEGTGGAGETGCFVNGLGVLDTEGERCTGGKGVEGGGAEVHPLRIITAFTSNKRPTIDF